MSMFNNPWSDVDGFVELGSCTLDGVYYELYCFPGRNDVQIMHIGARYGEDENYISATVVRERRFGEGEKQICYCHYGPIVEAVRRMKKRNLFTNTLYDINGNVIVKL